MTIRLAMDLVQVRRCEGGTVSGCRTPRLEISMSFKVLKPSRPQIPNKWTYYRGDARRPGRIARLRGLFGQAPSGPQRPQPAHRRSCRGRAEVSAVFQNRQRNAQTSKSYRGIVVAPSDAAIRNNLTATPSQLGRRTSGSTPRTLSEWLTKQERDGGRY